ncbi:MAG: thioredoxin domain-containing protein [Deltaproteobacteria bacterium]|nr:thioredoxin domain-containing protein [Deltaproteobacteria bacterium]
MRTRWLPFIAAAMALGTAASGRASDLAEIKETQKKILERLDAQDKILKDIQAKIQQLPAGGGRPQIDPNKLYEIPIADSSIRGPKDAPVTLVEFSDFQCPFCAQTTPLLEQVLAAYPKQVRFVYKQFPLEQIHQNALAAAKASIAARHQGKFWEMHDELFKISRELSPENIRAKARLIGLDLKKFDADLASPATEKEVRDDIALGRSADVQGTPTLFINGKRVTNRSLDGMKAMIDDALEKAKS